MKNLIIAFAVLALLTSVAWAGIDRIDRQVSSELEMKPTRSLTYFYDGADDGTPDPWITVDNTMTPQPIRWHVTTHLVAYGTYAYFCGIEPPAPELTGDLNGDGGYGNDWDQWLDLPPVAGITAAGYPMISYSHRFDMELGFDYCVVEAQILGVYTDMMGAGFEHTGVSGPGPDPTWQTMVAIGWNLTGADDPLIARFRMPCRRAPNWLPGAND